MTTAINNATTLTAKITISLTRLLFKTSDPSMLYVILFKSANQLDSKLNK